MGGPTGCPEVLDRGHGPRSDPGHEFVDQRSGAPPPRFRRWWWARVRSAAGRRGGRASSGPSPVARSRGALVDRIEDELLDWRVRPTQRSAAARLTGGSRRVVNRCRVPERLGWTCDGHDSRSVRAVDAAVARSMLPTTGLPGSRRGALIAPEPFSAGRIAGVRSWSGPRGRRRVALSARRLSPAVLEPGRGDHATARGQRQPSRQIAAPGGCSRWDGFTPLRRKARRGGSRRMVVDAPYAPQARPSPGTSRG